jgi:serine protease Do
MPDLKSAIASALVITLPQAAFALTGAEVNAIAEEITVLIYGQGEDNGQTFEAHGSGFIVARDGNKYYALTNMHVVAGLSKVILITPDSTAHPLDLSRVQSLPGVDLALVEFTSDNTYQVATLAPAATSEGQRVFVSGWPAAGHTGQLVRQFTSGEISGFLPELVFGYEIIYTNVTRGGMSGGPVLDAGGRVVAIHGRGDTEDPNRLAGLEGVSPEAARNIASLIKPGFNYSIPIRTYLQLAAQQGIFLATQVDNTPAPDLVGNPEVAADNNNTIEPSAFDRINDTLDTIERGINILDRIF